MEDNNWIEKTYCLYASEWHLTIMLLPFISKKLCENDRIYMKFENSIEDKIKQLTRKLNLKNKDDIDDIRWNMEINDDEYSSNEKIYIVAGSNEYIENMNKRINQFYRSKDRNIKIINCFNIETVKMNHNFFDDKSYINKLTTQGETLISAQ